MIFILIVAAVMGTFVLYAYLMASLDSRSLKNKVTGADIKPIDTSATFLYPNTIKVIEAGGSIKKLLVYPAPDDELYYDPSTGAITPLGKRFNERWFEDKASWKTPKDMLDSIFKEDSGALKRFEHWRQAPIGFRWLAKRLGIFWVGFFAPATGHTKKFDLSWSETRRKEGPLKPDEVIIRHEKTTQLYIMRPYPRSFHEIEIFGRIEIDVWGEFTLFIVLPARFLYVSGKDVLERAFGVIAGQIAFYFDQKKWNPDATDDQKASKEFVDPDDFEKKIILGANDDLLRVYGCILVQSRYVMSTLSPDLGPQTEVEKATQGIQIKKLAAEAAREEAAGKRDADIMIADGKRKLYEADSILPPAAIAAKHMPPGGTFIYNPSAGNQTPVILNASGQPATRQ